MEYQNLLRPFTIGDTKIPNRIVMAPVYTAYGSKDSKVTDLMINYYQERALGGTGMIVVEAMAVHSSGHGMEKQIALYQDNVQKGLEKLSRAIKDAGAIAVAQIHHIGKFNTLGKALSPSKATFQFGGAELSSTEISRKEMDDVRDAFANAALIIKNTGFDMVEIHGGAGYLIASFFSPHSNSRNDEYGGSVEKRAKYPLEIVKAVKETVGKNFCVGWRLSVDEKLPDGIRLAHNIEFVPMLEKAGIAYISPVVGSYESFFLPEVMKELKRPGYAVHYSEELRKKVNIPVFANGRIIAPKMAEDIIVKKQADAIALGRPLVSDPRFVYKIKSEKANEIKACKACDKCMMNIMMGKKIKCDNWKKV